MQSKFLQVKERAGPPGAMQFKDGKCVFVPADKLHASSGGEGPPQRSGDVVGSTKEHVDRQREEVDAMRKTFHDKIAKESLHTSYLEQTNENWKQFAEKRSVVRSPEALEKVLAFRFHLRDEFRAQTHHWREEV
jgi:hypothetical protein